jgi:hypothetical protein
MPSVQQSRALVAELHFCPPCRDSGCLVLFDAETCLGVCVAGREAGHGLTDYHEDLTEGTQHGLGSTVVSCAWVVRFDV